jgi:hypothetical protein
MDTTRLVLSLTLFIIFLCDTTVAQSTAYSLLSSPRSIISSGMGEQGAAMKNPIDAMQYNPANLVYTETASMSYFVNPLIMENSRFPLVSKSFSMKLNSGAALGLEYNDWDGGNPELYDSPWGYETYQQSIAGTFAIPLGTDWAVGAQVRYAWSSLRFNRPAGNILFGAGASYTPTALSQRMTIGLALMNFGTPIEHIDPWPESADNTGPMPAQLNLAADYTLVRQQYYEITAGLGFTKPFVKLNGMRGYVYQSSYRALFTDWDKFPRDVTMHLGLGCQWKPMPLGGGIAYFQEMYLGYLTYGGSYGNVAIFTHGAKVGIEAGNVKAAIGYAGRWHKRFTNTYASWDDPWETFQLTLSTNWNAPERAEQPGQGKDRLKGILLSGGYAFCSPFEQSPEAAFSGYRNGHMNLSLFSVEADFYVSDKTSVITAVSFAHMTRHISAWADAMYSPPTNQLETLSLESGFRYHLKSSDPFFFQASIGILRLNQLTESVNPRYGYQAFATLAAGWVIPITDAGLTLMPKVGIRTVVMGGNGRDGQLQGFPQFMFGMNIGYML